MITPWKLPEWMAMLDPERYSDVFRGDSAAGLAGQGWGHASCFAPPTHGLGCLRDLCVKLVQAIEKWTSHMPSARGDGGTDWESCWSYRRFQAVTV